MATSNRPQVIAAKDVSAAVDQAVKLATEKHKEKFGPDFHIGPGTIMGRYLLESATALKQAQQIATEITQHVNEQGAARGPSVALPRFEPAVLLRNNLILCGFYPGPIVDIQEKF
jgi:hypothetical protein